MVAFSCHLGRAGSLIPAPGDLCRQRQSTLRTEGRLLQSRRGLSTIRHRQNGQLRPLNPHRSSGATLAGGVKVLPSGEVGRPTGRARVAANDVLGISARQAAKFKLHVSEQLRQALEASPVCFASSPELFTLQRATEDGTDNERGLVRWKREKENSPSTRE